MGGATACISSTSHRRIARARAWPGRALINAYEKCFSRCPRSGNVKTLEVRPPLLQFPSAEAAEAFVTDPEYAPYAAARKGRSESRF